MSFTYSIAVILIGVTSLYYHASLTFLGQWFDVMSMYLLAIFMLVYNLARKSNLKSSSFLLLYIGLNAIAGLIQYYYPEARRYLFAFLLVLAMVSEIFARKAFRGVQKLQWLLAAIASIALAFVIWILDIRKIICLEHSFLQGHAAWHILCALTSFFLYLYYRNEERHI